MPSPTRDNDNEVNVTTVQNICPKDMIDNEQMLLIFGFVSM